MCAGLLLGFLCCLARFPSSWPTPGVLVWPCHWDLGRSACDSEGDELKQLICLAASSRDKAREIFLVWQQKHHELRDKQWWLNGSGPICAYIPGTSLHQCQLSLGSAEAWARVGLLELLVTVPCRVAGSVFGLCRTPVGRGRAWLRLALMQKKLSEYMKALINRKDLLRWVLGSFSVRFTSAVLWDFNHLAPLALHPTVNFMSPTHWWWRRKVPSLLASS